MHDPQTFETRLTSALRRYTADDPTVIDAVELARTIAADARVRRAQGIRGTFGLRPVTRTVRLAACCCTHRPARCWCPARRQPAPQAQPNAPRPAGPGGVHPDRFDGDATRGWHRHVAERWARPCHWWRRRQRRWRQQRRGLGSRHRDLRPRRAGHLPGLPDGDPAPGRPRARDRWPRQHGSSEAQRRDLGSRHDVLQRHGGARQGAVRSQGDAAAGRARARRG